ncbi:hypothetical protein OMP38_23425 [Cohnella ginsengisoli]|uniref:Uncharacterized protein n=1 Tax=Cohnella ginsengisoli TaxID=425004 RepID=A0A9X4QQ76_9BACL|nr:hypothetical protein [Cohnella ginsengisoli]MDG0793460.1 hypothetical protein [Cohnella ginsengisoli]
MHPVNTSLTLVTPLGLVIGRLFPDARGYRSNVAEGRRVANDRSGTDCWRIAGDKSMEMNEKAAGYSAGCFFLQAYSCFAHFRKIPACSAISFLPASAATD